EKPRARLDVTPRELRRARDADARPGEDLGDARSRFEPERPPIERKPVVRPGDPERLAELPRARAERPDVVEAAPLPRPARPLRRLEGPDERRLRDAFVAAHEVQAPVDPVRAVDVGVAGRPEHRCVARGATAAVAVACRILVVVRLDL